MPRVSRATIPSTRFVCARVFARSTVSRRQGSSPPGDVDSAATEPESRRSSSGCSTPSWWPRRPRPRAPPRGRLAQRARGVFHPITRRTVYQDDRRYAGRPGSCALRPACARHACAARRDAPETCYARTVRKWSRAAGLSCAVIFTILGGAFARVLGAVLARFHQRGFGHRNVSPGGGIDPRRRAWLTGPRLTSITSLRRATAPPARQNPHDSLPRSSQRNSTDENRSSAGGRTRQVLSSSSSTAAAARPAISRRAAPRAAHDTPAVRALTETTPGAMSSGAPASLGLPRQCRQRGDAPLHGPGLATSAGRRFRATLARRPRRRVVRPTRPTRAVSVQVGEFASRIRARGGVPPNGPTFGTTPDVSPPLPAASDHA